MTLTFALSVRNFIEDIGSYAGFAAVVALALFTLLLFAQAREIKRLRDWGADAHDRLGELERNLAAALEMARRAVSAPRSGQQTAAGQPAAAQRAQPARPAAARGRAAAPAAAAPAAAAAGAARLARTSAPVRPQLLPAAPVGVAGPPLASATVLIPLPGAPAAAPPLPPAPARPAARPAVAAAATGAGPRERVAPATPAAAPRERAAAPAARDRSPLAADPASGNGHRDDPPTELAAAAPRRATAAAARPAAPRRDGAGRPAARPRPAGPAGTAGRPPRGGARNAAPQGEPPHGRRRLVGVLAVVAALVVVAIGAVVLLGGGDDDKPGTVRVEAPAGSARGGARRRARAPPPPAHDQTTVAVLNGTGVTGLASSVMDELTGQGFRKGNVADASDTERTQTVVEYRNGQEAAAREVARSLDLSPDAVSAIRPDSEESCRRVGPCLAQVIVTVGADRNPTQ